MASIRLDESAFGTLKRLSIGQRIGYMRELLRKAFGSDYSTRNVAARIKVISFPALNAIERGATKEPPAKVVYEIAKDFNVDIQVFFDDFYSGDVKTMSIGPSPDKEHNKSFSNVTAIPTENYKLVVYVFQENDEGARRIVQAKTSDQKLDRWATIQFTSLIYHQLESYNYLTGTPRELDSFNPFTTAVHRYDSTNKYPEEFPWIPKNLWEQKFEEMRKGGVENE